MEEDRIERGMSMSLHKYRSFGDLRGDRKEVTRKRNNRDGRGETWEGKLDAHA